MSDTETTVRITANASGVSAGVQQAVNEMNRLPPAAKAVSSSLNEAQTAFKATGSSLSDMAKTASKASSDIHGSAGTIRESMVIVREAARGNWTRMAGSLSLLAQYTGAMPALLSPVSLGLIAMAAAAGSVAFAMHQGQEDQKNFTNALIATNQWAGITETQLHDLGIALGTQTKEGAGKARDVLIELVRTGTFTGDNLKLVAKTALDLAHVFGGEATDQIKQFSGLQLHTVETAYKLQQQFHGLTAEQFQHVIALTKAADATGDFAKRQEAIRIVMESIDGPLKTQKENVGFLEKAWRGLTQAISGAIEAMMSWGRTPTTDVQLKSAESLRDRLLQVRDVHGQIPPHIQAEINKQETLIASLRQKLGLEEQSAVAKAKAAKVDDPKITKAFEAYKDDKKGAKAPSQVPALREALEQELDVKKSYLDDSNRIEIEYWTKVLQTVRLSTRDRLTIEHTIHEALKQDARRAYQDQIANIKEGEQQKVEAARTAFDEAKQTFDEQREAARASAGQELITKQELATRLRAINQAERQAALRDLADEREAKVAALTAERALAEKAGGDTARLNARKLTLDETYLQQRAALVAKYAKIDAKTNADAMIASTEAMNKAITKFSDGVSMQFAQLVGGQKTFAQSMLGVWQSMIGSLEQSFAKSLSNILQMQLRNLLLSNGAEKAAGTKDVMTAAKTAAAKAYSATVGIPVVGPVLAPAAAATAFAGVMAFLPSAAKGYDIPAGTNPLTQLHEREMVLPADLADKVRNSTGSGGGTQIHIHALDARQIGNWLDNGGGDQIIKHLQRANRNFQGAR